MFPIFSFAHAGHGDVLNSVEFKRAIVEDKKCDEIEEGEFEQLGEKIMSFMHPDQDDHNFMDKMMGGEGSESLKQMHISMGKRHLDCYDGSLSSGNMMRFNNTMPMMFGGMMGSSLWVGSAFSIVLLLAVIIFLVWLVLKKNKDKS